MHVQSQVHSMLADAARRTQSNVLSWLCILGLLRLDSPSSMMQVCHFSRCLMGNLRSFCVPQTRPPRGRKTTLEEAPRIATIHEYLDWTVTAEDALGDNELVLPCAHGPAFLMLSPQVTSANISVPY